MALGVWFPVVVCDENGWVLVGDLDKAPLCKRFGRHTSRLV